MQYQNIPVDPETKQKVVLLAKKFGFGERGQGAMVRMLVNEKMLKLGMLPATPVNDASLISEDVSPLPAVDEVA